MNYVSKSLGGAFLIALVVLGAYDAKAITEPFKRIELVGRGAIIPNGSCSESACPGKLLATIDMGRKRLFHGDMEILVDVQKEPNGFTGCRAITGRGQLKGDTFAVRFVGQLCEPDPGARYSVSGDVQIFTNTNRCAAQDETTASGTLQLFGAIGSPGTVLAPIPYGDTGALSIVGATGQVPICDP